MRRSEESVLTCRLGMPFLPGDVTDRIAFYVHRHHSCRVLQAACHGMLARRALIVRRHRLHQQLHMCLEECRPGLYGKLLPYSGVRREWKEDPMAWIITLKSDNAQVSMERILEECQEGIWGARSWHHLYLTPYP